ncbi:hypothetical protein CYY_004063 [Polysphondylium violaceum]|uniref:Methyltransferase domain-containing protein n=1 Tax=Polysphondylium violaceum TaxID=133409 RepID=A0A8J4V840_9MYCE|nr:hypothetical protein CYY_004063 [Polysphondylium violaceum]
MEGNNIKNNEFSAQNIYDKDNFVEIYLETFKKPKVDRWGIFVSHLPKSLQGMNVLELGCGSGNSASFLVEEGANHVTGYDISQKMIELAKKSNEKNKNTTFEVKDLETLQLPEQEYDLVLSLYTFHYIFNYEGLIQTIAKSLKPGGKLVFFVEHPVFTASIEQPTWIERPTSGEKAWTVSNYFNEGKRVTNWISFDGVIKCHRTVSSYMQTPINHGLTLTHFEEFCPSAQLIEKDPKYIENLNRPQYLNLSYTKKE